MKIAPKNVLLDTGALVSLIPLWQARELGIEIKRCPNVCVRGADRKALQFEGVGSVYMRDIDATFW